MNKQEWMSKQGWITCFTSAATIEDAWQAHCRIMAKITARKRLASCQL